MRLHRNPVRWLSSWLVVALLFMQLATAVHACPRLGASDPGPASSVEMPDCAMTGAVLANSPHNPYNLDNLDNLDNPNGSDSPAGLLCSVHCQQGQQALDQSPAADLAATPLLLVVLDWAAPALEGDAAGLGAACLSAANCAGVAAGPPPPGALPIYLSLLVLRH